MTLPIYDIHAATVVHVTGTNYILDESSLAEQEHLTGCLAAKAQQRGMVAHVSRAILGPANATDPSKSDRQ